jgi:hypothetical protein
LRRIPNLDRVVWDGSLIIESNIQAIKLDRLNDMNDNSVRRKLIESVTKYFEEDVGIIPYHLFLYALPRFDHLPEALTLLRQHFPHMISSPMDILLGEQIIWYQSTDIFAIPSILRSLRNSGYFLSVDVAITQYGGLPRMVHVDGLKLGTKTDLFTRINEIADRVMSQVMCGDGCDRKPVATDSSNLRSYEIVGKSSSMFIKRPNIWEKYKVTMTMFMNDPPRDGIGTLEVQFQLTSGWTAAFRGDVEPPVERFNENPIRDADLEELTSKLLPRI